VAQLTDQALSAVLRMRLAEGKMALVRFCAEPSTVLGSWSLGFSDDDDE
jgi:hypothetical protein